MTRGAAAWYGRLGAAAAGLAADAWLGEPRTRTHPVAAFGAAMRRREAMRWDDSRASGARHAFVGIAAGAGTGWVSSALAARAATGGPAGATAAACYLATAGRALREAARSVGEALDAGDLDRARSLLPALVGRDTAGLGEKDIVRAVVESVAENTVDAVVAPVMWAAAAGAPGALGYRAANTLDAMVGHRGGRYERFGWASARLDDLAGWLPARVTAVLVAAVRPAAAAQVARAVLTQAAAHPSPNAGVAEAAFAAALGLRLGGTSRYGGQPELRPALGFGHPPEQGDIAAALDLSSDVGRALALCLLAVASVGLRARAGRGRRLGGPAVRRLVRARSRRGRQR